MKWNWNWNWKLLWDENWPQGKDGLGYTQQIGLYFYNAFVKITL